MPPRLLAGDRPQTPRTLLDIASVPTLLRHFAAHALRKPLLSAKDRTSLAFRQAEAFP